MRRSLDFGGALLTMLTLTAALGLGGCGGSGQTIGQALGYGQKGPDEMVVIKRPPLVLPPDYNLRPPRPGEQRADIANAGERARRMLLGQAPAAGATDESAPSAGQTVLLGRTNRIERNLDALTDSRSENRVDGALLRRLLTWRPPSDAKSAGAGERALLDQAADAAAGGKGTTSPAIVQIVRRQQTPIDPGTLSE